jgi:hypothetical protein
MKLKDITPNDQTVYVGLLIEEQKNSLIGVLYCPDSYFNPILDANNNWVISREEMEFCINPDYLWVKDLELILFVPPPTQPNTDMQYL